MKLNTEGEKLYGIWEQNYYKENDNLGGNSTEGDFIEGWSIIDNTDYIKTLTDVCGLLVFGYDEEAIQTVEAWIKIYGSTEKAYGFTYEEIKTELLKYFE